MAGGQVSEGTRLEMLKAFDETKVGVKGLIDSGIEKIPKIFVRPSEDLTEEPSDVKIEVQVPVIDLSGILNPSRRQKIVKEVKTAAETWGFFQVVNHGIPLKVMDGMIEGVRRFHEHDVVEKMKFYTRDPKKSVRFQSSYDLFISRTASWRDTLSVTFTDPDHNLDNELPDSCRDSVKEYSKHVQVLGNSLLGLLSEALGLMTNHLEDMECATGHALHCHYYPACPEPDVTIGTTKHSDAGFLTILLQSQNISALQALYNSQWVDIHPTPGSLVINIGDLLQLVSNGRLKSSKHRAITNITGPRISVACFLGGPINGTKTYGPIVDLISEENPPIYKEIDLMNYKMKFLKTDIADYLALQYYEL